MRLPSAVAVCAVSVCSVVVTGCPPTETATSGDDVACSDEQRALSDACLPDDLVRHGDAVVASAATGDAVRVEDAAGDAVFAVSADGTPRWSGVADGAAARADACGSADDAARAARADGADDSDALGGQPAAAYVRAGDTVESANFCASADFANFASTAAVADDSARLGGLDAVAYARLDGAQTFSGAKDFSAGLSAADVVANAVDVGTLTPARVVGGSFEGGSFAGGSFDGVHRGDGSGLTNIATELRYDRGLRSGCDFDAGTVRCDGVVCATDASAPSCTSLPAACAAFCVDSDHFTGAVDIGHVVVPDRGVLRGRLSNPLVCKNAGGSDASVSLIFAVCQDELCNSQVPVVLTSETVPAGTNFSFGRTQGPRVFENGVGATASFFAGQRRVILALSTAAPSTTCFVVQSVSPGFTPNVTLSLTPYVDLETW